MNPAWPSLALTITIGPGQPANLRCDAATLAQGSSEILAYAIAAADAVQERRLEDPWNAERR